MSNLDQNIPLNATDILFILQDAAERYATHNLIQAPTDTFEYFGPFPENFILPDTDFDNIITATLGETELEKNDSIEVLLTEQKYQDTLNPDNSPCLICQEEFQDGETVSVLECNHIFHKDCVANWGKYRQDCPACRHPIQFTNHSPLQPEEEIIIDDEQTPLTEDDIALVMEQSGSSREEANSNDVFIPTTIPCPPNFSFDIIARSVDFPTPHGQLGDDVEGLTIQ